jgi:hypothetical protein
MYLQKVMSQKLGKKYFFVDFLKVTDENSRIRIRIRICNTGLFYACIYTISNYFYFILLVMQNV